MTPRPLLLETAERFRNAGISDPEVDSALLLSHLCGSPPLNLRLDDDTQLDQSVLDLYASMVKRRLAREPLQYIMQEACFFGHVFYVDSRVLIPRPETELLCEWVLSKLEPVPCPHVLDLCCGSGCIGLSIALRRPDASVMLSDCSADALSVASENADRLRLHVALHQGDLTEGLPEAGFDVVVSNPPYIPTQECNTLQPEVQKEPLLALDGGEDGLSFYRRIALDTPRILKKGGLLLMELGWRESEAVSALLAGAGFSSIEIRKDMNGTERMICAVRPCSEELCLKS